MNLTKEQKDWFYAHLRVLAYGTLAWMMVDGLMALTQVFQGDWNMALLLQLGQLILTSMVKALFNEIFPTLFPLPTYPKK